MTITLTTAERRALSLMCALACRWEESLIQANYPDHGGAPGTDAARTIRKCRRSIRQFHQLHARLQGVTTKERL